MSHEARLARLEQDMDDVLDSLDRIEDVICILFEQLAESDKAKWEQVLKARMETMRAKEKLTTSLRYTNKRVTDQENSQKGLVAWIHGNQKDKNKYAFNAIKEDGK